MSYKHSITLDDLCFSLPKIKKKKTCNEICLSNVLKPNGICSTWCHL